MNKIMVFLRGPSGMPRDAFQQLVLARARAGLPEPLARDPMTVNLVYLPFARLPYRPPNDTSAGKAPEYDAIVEAWGRRDQAAIAADLLAGFGARASAFHAYAVTATQLYHRREFARGQPSDGIKLIGRLMFHADLPDSAARRSWGLHAPLAARVHVGSARYVQNWVDRVLMEASPQARGIPIMHFPSEHDFFEGFADSPRGMDEIIQDTAHFVAGGPRCYTAEYVVRDGP